MPCTHLSDGAIERIDIAGFVSEVSYCSLCGERMVKHTERPWYFSSGSWRVTRNKTADPDSPRIVHAENLTKQFAQIVARNWRAFNAQIEEMEIVKS